MLKTSYKGANEAALAYGADEASSMEEQETRWPSQGRSQVRPQLVYVPGAVSPRWLSFSDTKQEVHGPLRHNQEDHN